MKELKQLVQSLPPVNYNLLKYICRCLLPTDCLIQTVTMAASRSIRVVLGRFLDEVQSYSGVNKMTVQNLATVFGPNILRPKVEDPVAIMEGQCRPFVVSPTSLVAMGTVSLFTAASFYISDRADSNSGFSFT